MINMMMTYHSNINKNGRIYPKELFDREIEIYKKMFLKKIRKEKLNKIYGKKN